MVVGYVCSGGGGGGGGGGVRNRSSLDTSRNNLDHVAPADDRGSVIKAHRRPINIRSSSSAATSCEAPPPDPSLSPAADFDSTQRGFCWY